jgi:hypothetical protein
MKAFQTIIQKYHGQEKYFILNGSINIEFSNYVYSNKYYSITQSANMFYIYILQICSENPREFINKKFSRLNSILKNVFILDEDKEKMLNDFSKIQRIYYGFVRLANIYKFKKANIQIDTDLCMNELNPNKSNVFVLCQKKQKYYFSAIDLINMFNRNLSNCFNFSPEPNLIKNPYNNIYFNNKDLYNIYFFLRWNNYVIPELIQGYFLCNFNLKEFRDNYEFNILNIYIKNYIYNSHSDTLYPCFTRMWRYYKNITKNVIINENFPRDKLINIMKPYLHLYYTALYATHGTYKQCNAEYILKKKLRLFVNYNPNFGRRYIRYKRDVSGKNIKIIIFDSDHIHFYKGMHSSNVVQRNTRLRNDNYDINSSLFNSINYDSAFEEDYEDENENEERQPILRETNVVSYLITQLVNEQVTNSNRIIVNQQNTEDADNSDNEVDQQDQEQEQEQDNDIMELEYEYSSTDDDSDSIS